MHNWHLDFLDFHGFLGLDDSVRLGYPSIRVRFNVNADADAKENRSPAERFAGQQFHLSGSSTGCIVQIQEA